MCCAEGPTRAMLDANEDFWGGLERGMARYVIVHEQGEPKQIYFAGYSFD